MKKIYNWKLVQVLDKIELVTEDVKLFKNELFKKPNNTITTLNFQNFSEITYAFTVTPRLVLTGIIYGLILTLIAGLMPGVRAARTPITTGLREL